jgi:hypothetical protein
MDDAAKWPLWSRTCWKDFQKFRGKKGSTGTVTEDDVLEWTLELHKSVMLKVKYPGAKTNLNKLINDPPMRRAFLTELRLTLTQWMAHNYPGREFDSEVVPEWSYIYIKNLMTLDKAELSGALKEKLLEKIGRSSLPGFMKKAYKRVVRASARRLVKGKN